MGRVAQVAVTVASVLAEMLGVLLVVAGIAQWSQAAAMIALGLVFVFAGIRWDRGGA